MLEERHLYMDRDLGIEYCTFINLPQSFPSHCHDYYVIGLIIKGYRQLTCRQEVSELAPGDLFVLNPYDPHACAQIGTIPLDYQCLHVSPKKMKELTGIEIIFNDNVIRSRTAKKRIKALFQGILAEENKATKEDLFYILLSTFPTRVDQPESPLSIVQQKTINQVVTYMTNHCQNKLTLDQLAHISELNKFTLIRLFLKGTGLTPYQYLETIRITKAKDLLRKQTNLLDISFNLGYNDQSHFSNAFKKLTGLTPKRYQKTYT
ncbi:AraC family transcriptional regulator [uncultured Vagococcus sp.]|uniref:AraC family transcriptional regulator n=1 Tax=uncultured Vagococcus sp. TaxID=189676 RepID=UPI0028D1CFCC|nr:AraC family transcriptional regulator [uncultured Vagococcus sp.]